MALSLLVHGVLLLGVGFALESAAPVMPTLYVNPAQTASARRPSSRFPRPASNQGGGEHDKTTRPRDNQSGAAPQPNPGSPRGAARAVSAPHRRHHARVVSSARGEAQVSPPRHSRLPANARCPSAARRSNATCAGAARRGDPPAFRTLRQAPKRKFVSASTRSFAWAGYMRAWVARVERIGNLNYPTRRAGRGSRPGGDLVAIRRTARSRADIVQSSGTPLLDSSALRIAKLSEPYPRCRKPRTTRNPARHPD